MKKIIFFLVIMVAFITLASCTSDDEKILNNARDNLVIGYQGNDSASSVTSNLILSTSIDEVSITWTSDKPSVIDETGFVIRQSRDTTVVLTATLSHNNNNAVKDFSVTVISGNSKEDLKTYIKNLLTENFSDFPSELALAITYFSNVIDESEEIDVIKKQVEDYIPRVFFAMASTISYGDFAGLEDKYTDYLTTLRSNSVASLVNYYNQADLDNRVAKIKSTIDIVIDMAKGNDSTLDCNACESGIFEVCEPIIELREEKNVYEVVRGFRGDIANLIGVTVVDYNNIDVTSLLSLEGDYQNFQILGDFEVTLVANDMFGNQSRKVVTLRVTPQSVMPTLSATNAGETIEFVEIGSIDYLEGVTAFDALGLELTGEVNVIVKNNNSEVINDIETPGLYYISYSVEDIDGNIQSKLAISGVSGLQDYRFFTVLPASVSWSTEVETDYAKEPGLLYLMVDDVLSWTPRNDDEYTGVSTIALQPRMTGEAINKGVDENVKLAILDVFTPVGPTGIADFQGFDYYGVDYWQYIDIAVAWGGQIASFTIPSRDIVNAAHKNGVKIIGNVFMAPREYGGQVADTYQMLSKNEENKFPFADKMLEIAKYFGFDGWFINFETDGGDLELANSFQEFLYYTKEIAAQNYPEMIIQNYDSMRNDGRIAWQGALNDQNSMFFQDDTNVLSDSLFIDFRWDGRYEPLNTDPNFNNIKNSADYATSIGRNPFDLYTGFDTQQYGYGKSSSTATDWQWDRFIDPNTNTPYTSIGFYRSDWVFNLDGGIGGNDYNAYLKTSNVFYTGFGGDPRKQVDFSDLYPSKDAKTNWPGVSALVAEKTTVIGESFSTNFNTGNGYQMYENGEVVSSFSGGWNNISLQDIMPHFRWIKDTLPDQEPLSIDFNFDRAYTGGSNLQISGDISNINPSRYTVYKTYLDVYEDTSLNLKYYVNNIDVKLQVKLNFEDSVGWYNDEVLLDLAPEEVNAWNSEAIDLSPYLNKKITTIGFVVSSEDETPFEYKVNFGHLSVKRNTNTDLDEEITNFTFQAKAFQSAKTSDVRLTWNLLNLSETIYYKVYHKTSHNTVYLATSLHNYVYIKNIQRYETDDVSELIVIAYLASLKEVGRATLELEWPEAIAGGRVSFTASKTVIKVDEVITLNAIKSPITESLEWNIYDGTIISGTLSDESIQIKYEKEGIYALSLTTMNSIGSNTHTVEYAIIVSNIAATVTNLSLSGRIDSYSGYNTSRTDEQPKFMIDGSVATKWCETDSSTTGDKWIVVDLRDVYYVSEINVFHSLNDPYYANDPRWVTKSYQLYYSTDKVNWEMVVEVVDNVAKTTFHSFSPIKMRYVKLVVTAGSQVDNHSRIQELEIWGKK